MNTIPLAIWNTVLDYAIPLIPCIRPEFEDLPISSLAKNPMQFAYVYYHGLPMTFVSPITMSQQSDNFTVEYLLAHPQYIDIDTFCKNPHKKAVRYMLSVLQYCNEFHWKNASLNTNDEMVQYLLQHPRKIDWHIFSKNTNDIAVDYLVQHTEKIWLQSFSQNKNPRAITYLLQHPDSIIWEFFCQHNDERVVDYLFRHILVQPLLQRTLLHYLSENTHDAVVRYMIDHRLVECDSFWKNTNPLAIDYILFHIKEMYMWQCVHPDKRIFMALLHEPINRIHLIQHPDVFYFQEDIYTKNNYRNMIFFS